MNLLENVNNEHQFWLNNGKVLKNLKELYKELRRMDDKVFVHHLNESKNDFYNWVDDIYKNKTLSNDLLECTTKEAILFCLRNHLKQASTAKSLDTLPKGYTPNPIQEELPKGYNNQRITNRTAKTNPKSRLVTLINLDEIRINTEVKNLFKENKPQQKAIKTSDPFIEISKRSIKKVKVLDSKSMISKVKEVYLN